VGQTRSRERTTFVEDTRSSKKVRKDPGSAMTFNVA